MSKDAATAAISGRGFQASRSTIAKARHLRYTEKRRRLWMRFIRTAALFMSAVFLQAAVPPVPRHAPEFVIHFPDGSQQLLSSYRGKVVALLFVYTTCVHCQHTSQVFTKLNAEYGARGFQPIDVAFNDMSNLFVKDFV